MKGTAAVIAILLATPWAVTSARADCVPAATPDQVIEGRLVAKGLDGPGPPQQAFIVVLPAATCLIGRDRADRVDGVAMVQIFSREDALRRRMAALVGKGVAVHGSAFPGLGAYHQAPVVMSVAEIERVYDANERRTVGLGDACTLAGCGPDQGPISDDMARPMAEMMRPAVSDPGKAPDAAPRSRPCVIGAGRATPSYATGAKPTMQQLVETWRADNIGIPGRRVGKGRFDIVDWREVGGRRPRAFLEFRILPDKGTASDFARDRCTGRVRPVELQVFYRYSRETGAWAPDDVRGESPNGLCSEERLWTDDEIGHLLAPGEPLAPGRPVRGGSAEAAPGSPAFGRDCGAVPTHTSGIGE